MKEQLEIKILSMVLPGLDTEYSFANYLRGVLSGHESMRSSHLSLYLALRQAQYRQITLREFVVAARDELDDPVYHDLTRALDQFLESDSLSQLHKKLLERGRIRVDHQLIGIAIICLLKQCDSRLAEEEKAILAKEGAARGCESWGKYVTRFVHDMILA